jgi:hypothetical protein
MVYKIALILMSIKGVIELKSMCLARGIDQNA